GDARRGRGELQALGQIRAAAAAGFAADRRRRDGLGGAAGGQMIQRETLREILQVGPIELEVLRRRSPRARAPTLLLLHGINPIVPQAPFLDLLAGHGEIVAPSHPGFGRSPGPDDRDTIYDLVHTYLGVIDALAAAKVTLIGFSFGGWIAAEVA